MSLEATIAIISAIFSAVAVLVAVITWKKARPIEKLQVEMSSQEFSRDSLLECFRLINDLEVMKSKKIIADIRRADKTGAGYMMPSDYEERVRKVATAYNQVCALYELGLLNKKNFNFVYGGAIVSTWKLVKDEIEKWREDSSNDEICKHFGTVERHLRIDENIDKEPY